MTNNMLSLFCTGKHACSALYPAEFLALCVCPWIGAGAGDYVPWIIVMLTTYMHKMNSFHIYVNQLDILRNPIHRYSCTNYSSQSGVAYLHLVQYDYG